MSVQSVGQTGSSGWLQTLQAMYGQTDTTSTMSSLLSLANDATSETKATSSGSSVGSFSDILSALLSGNGSLSYDMETGTLTNLSADQGGAADQNLTTSQDEVQNEDGSTTLTKTTTDAEGNVVGTDVKVSQTDGSYTETITIVGPDGKTLTRTVTGENTADGFLESSTLSDSNGNVWETASSLTAADGSVTRTLTRNGPNGDSTTETASYDASGQLVSASSAYTAGASQLLAETEASASLAATDTTGATASSDETSDSSGASGASSSGDDDDETTTTVSMTFTDKGIEETTTVTDADGNIVSQSSKLISTNGGQDESGENGEAGGTNRGAFGDYAAARFGLSQYSAQSSLFNTLFENGGLSTEV